LHAAIARVPFPLSAKPRVCASLPPVSQLHRHRRDAHLVQLIDLRPRELILVFVGESQQRAGRIADEPYFMKGRAMQKPASEQHDDDTLPKRLGGNDLSPAYVLLRVTLGINVALHGISRIVAGPASFASSLTKEFSSTVLPHFAVQGFGYALPWLEAMIGLLILLGALTRVALIAGAVLIVVLTFGSTLHQDWNIAGLQLIYAIVYFILIGWRQYNSLSVDALFSHGLGEAHSGDAGS
jgi:thiosulfate dehydrogenase (quinone) large subunit